VGNPKTAVPGDLSFNTPVPKDETDKKTEERDEKQFEKDDDMVKSDAFKWYGQHLDSAIDKFSNVLEMEIDIDDTKLAQQLRVNRQVVAALRAVKAEAESLEEAHGDGE